MSREQVSDKGILGRIFRQASKGKTPGAGSPGCCGSSKASGKHSSSQNKCCDIQIIDLDDEEKSTEKKSQM